MRHLLYVLLLLSLAACGGDDCPPDRMPAGGACVPIDGPDADAPDADAPDASDTGSSDARDSDTSGPCEDGSTRDCGTDEGSCEVGTETCVSGAWGECVGALGPMSEVCNGVDDDCDGEIDNDPTDAGAECGVDVGACEFGAEVCVGGALACMGGTGPTDETCNGIDDDCDGTDDEGVQTTFYRDADGDGRGDPSETVDACTAPAGYIATADDCDDTCAVCWTGATEVCDGEDNDCNGATDEGVLATFYRDVDGDGYGRMDLDACTMPPGYVTVGGDCDDANEDVFPGQTRFFPVFRDSNCDGAITRQVTRSSGSCDRPASTCRDDSLAWYTGTSPTCGEPFVLRACSVNVSGTCAVQTVSATQGCR